MSNRCVCGGKKSFSAKRCGVCAGQVRGGRKVFPKRVVDERACYICRVPVEECSGHTLIPNNHRYDGQGVRGGFLSMQARLEREKKRTCSCGGRKTEVSLECRVCFRLNAKNRYAERRFGQRARGWM